MVEQKLPKLTTGVRFPSPAPTFFLPYLILPEPTPIQQDRSSSICDPAPIACSKVSLDSFRSQTNKTPGPAGVETSKLKVLRSLQIKLVTLIAGRHAWFVS